jgi:hypothetical protein
MNPAPDASPRTESLPPRLAAHWGLRQANSPQAPFLFRLQTPLRFNRSGVREIIFRLRCWWLIQRIALKMWWRG